MFMKVAGTIFSLFLLAITATSTLAQSTFARNFIAEAKDGKAYLRWTISQGNTCDGITILRSEDQISYTPIGEISGVCGSTDSAQTYLFTDETPVLNKTNFYKLHFGLTGITATQSVYLFSAGGYSLYPNPTNDQCRLFFSNNGKKVSLLLYNLSGQAVQSIETTDNFFTIYTSYLAASMYFFVVHLPQSTIKGKLLVVH